MKYFGCAYYPEAWQDERTDTDIRLMREAHINCVRMGEFNWGKFEPVEGMFAFDQYRNVIEKFQSNGISVFLCTPTAAPPKWMSHQYPDILKTGRDGVHVSDGNRRHYCPSSPRYREFSRRIVRAMAKAFSAMPGVVGWQLDNEIAAEAENGFCFCPECEKRFQEHLETKYGTIKHLNEAWNGSFWSGEYSYFEEIHPRNLKRISHLAEYAQFMSRLYTEFAYEQRDILRQENSSWPITTNSWTSFIPDVAPEEIFSQLDCASCDSYIASDNIEFYRSMWDLYRNVGGCRKAFTVGETGAWNPVSSHKNNENALLVWAYDAIVHGAESIFYFRWRQSVMGEENHPAILPHSGIPGRAYDAVRQIGKELSGSAVFPLPDCPALIITDTLTGFITKYRDGGDFSYFRAIVRVNQALNRLGIAADIIPAVALQLESLGKYRLIVLPQIEYVAPELISALKAFERNGGVILAQCRLNRLDETGKFRLDSFPFGMHDLFGLRIGEWCGLLDKQDFREFAYGDDSSTASRTKLPAKQFGLDVFYDTFMELVIPEDCECLETYSLGAYSGTPLLTRKGNAFYQAVPFGEVGTLEVLRRTAKAAGIDTFDIPPKALRIQCGKQIIRVNSAQETQTIDGVPVEGYGIRVKS